MSQNLIVKPAMAQPLFSLNMPSVDDVIDKICLKQEGKEAIAIDYGDEAAKYNGV